MLKLNKFGHGSKEKPLCLRLIAVYDTETIGPYSNYLLPDPEIMGCVIYTQSGKGILAMKDGSKIKLYPESIVFARHPEVAGLISDSDDWRFHCYWFGFAPIELPFNIVSPYKDEASAQDNSFVDMIIMLLSKGSAAAANEANNLFTSKIYAFLNRPESPVALSNKNQKIQPIIDYLRDNVYSNERIDDIAKRSGYCEKQLRNIFKDSMGISPKQYIVQLKIDKSCELLESSSLSISQISETFSFSSPYHYTNTFKKIKGISPTLYRKKFLENH